MAREITVTGNKKIRTLQKQFTDKFPYLRLAILPLSEKGKKRQRQHDNNLNLSAVRTVVNPGKISLHGRTLVGNIEKRFEETFGLYAQVCWTKSNGKRYYTSGSEDQMNLTQLNKRGEEKGWQKGQPH